MQLYIVRENLIVIWGIRMHKYILAVMSFLILLKAVSADPVKAAENPEQIDLQKRVEQHFRHQAAYFGIDTEGKNLKEVREELQILQEGQGEGKMEK